MKTLLLALCVIFVSTSSVFAQERVLPRLKEYKQNRFGNPPRFLGPNDVPTTIHRITFYGNAIYSDGPLLDCCRFKVGDRLRSVQVLSAKLKIQELYKSAGFANVIVKIDRKSDEDAVVFRISEGVRETVPEVALRPADRVLRDSAKLLEAMVSELEALNEELSEFNRQEIESPSDLETFAWKFGQIGRRLNKR